MTNDPHVQPDPQPNPEAEQLARDAAVVADYPDIFGSPPPQGLMADGFRMGPGWRSLLLDLLAEMRPLVREAGVPSFRIQQVKQKLAGLRVYVSRSIPAVDDAIRRAEARAWKTCERCREPGTFRGSRPLVQTLCDACEAEVERQETLRRRRGW